ncbi:MAG: chloride channel protein [Gemmatimonadales bacterium]
MSPSAGRPSMSMPEQAGLTPDPPTARGQTGLVKLSLLSVATGAATGLTVGFFRLALERADWFRSQLVSRLHEWPALGLPVLVTIVAAATALAAWLVLRSAQPASGSGIPHVVVGMAALFTAVVRAPVTGIILTMELTAGFNQLLPMLWACFAAMAVPTLLGNAPVYDSLKARMVRPATGVARSRRI